MASATKERGFFHLGFLELFFQNRTFHQKHTTHSRSFDARSSVSHHTGLASDVMWVLPGLLGRYFSVWEDGILILLQRRNERTTWCWRASACFRLLTWFYAQAAKPKSGDISRWTHWSWKVLKTFVYSKRFHQPSTCHLQTSPFSGFFSNIRRTI